MKSSKSYDYQQIFLLMLIQLISSINQSEIHSLKCNKGNNISFECPCPEELNDCRFKKLFQGGYIVRDDVLNSRYQFNDNRTRITLKECNEDDEGTYVWMCGRCNVNRQFDLQVQIVSEGHIEEMKHCSVGGDISFECPCCAEELDSCRFKKLEQEGYIVRDGLLNAQNFNYEFKGKKTQVILKECNEDDEGTYVWMCERCDVNKQFNLKVQNSKPIPETPQNLASLLTIILIILLSGLCTLCLILIWFIRKKSKP